MAETKLDLTTAKTVTITNILKSGEMKDSPVGERVLTSYSEIKKDIERGVYVDFEYALDKDGNFQYYAADTGLTAIDTTAALVTEEDAPNKDPKGASGVHAMETDKIAVIVRRSIKANDRYIQFYRTQQKLLLAPQEALTFKVDKPDACAHYMSLAIPGEITVVVA